jgi:hypothetical protein
MRLFTAASPIEGLKFWFLQPAEDFFMARCASQKRLAMLALWVIPESFAYTMGYEISFDTLRKGFSPIVKWRC